MQLSSSKKSPGRQEEEADQRNYDSLASKIDPGRWDQSFKSCVKMPTPGSG